VTTLAVTSSSHRCASTRRAKCRECSFAHDVPVTGPPLAVVAFRDARHEESSPISSYGARCWHWCLTVRLESGSGLSLYLRYDTSAQLAVLTELYRQLRLLTNFFVPQAKLIAKTREGAKVNPPLCTPSPSNESPPDRPPTPTQLRSVADTVPELAHRTAMLMASRAAMRGPDVTCGGHREVPAVTFHLTG